MPGVLHWGPLTAITIISIVTVTSTYSALQLWGLPTVTYFRLPNFILMYVWLGLIAKNYYQALKCPGYVTLGWKPDKQSDEEFLQYCRVCQGYKPPRSHHCSQCGRCIMKMDHHCPWINACVGHMNHAAFIRFLFYVPFGCIHGIIVNSNFLYRLVSYDFIYYHPYLKVTTFWVMFPVAGIGLAIGTTIGVSLLFALQAGKPSHVPSTPRMKAQQGPSPSPSPLKSVFTNQTQIEEWIMDKAKSRRKENNEEAFVFPYDVGCRVNFTEVINWSGRAKGDGIHWRVREGCSQYTFTMEQIQQKKRKKQRAVMCRVECDYGGSQYPVTFGLSTCLCSPKCGEGTITVLRGDIVAVTRWQMYWVYGDKQLPSAEVDQGRRVKGWFPRACVRVIKEISASKDDDNTSTVRKRTKQE